MTIESALIISVVSVGFGIYQGMSNLKRNEKVDYKSEATQLTTVIVKLENIGTGIAEIKNEMSNIKDDMKEDRERIVKVEALAEMTHQRLNECEKYCKMRTANSNQENNKGE